MTMLPARQFLERAKGFEPSTYGLGNRRSAPVSARNTLIFQRPGFQHIYARCTIGALAAEEVD